jgi:UPF0755 protein
MTDYGRGSGSAPWHPEGPLYGDQGWDGQQAEGAPPAPPAAPVQGLPHQQPYPQQPHHHDVPHQQGYAQQQQQQHQYIQQQYGQQQEYDPQQHPQGPYGQQQYVPQPQPLYGHQGYDPYEPAYPEQQYQGAGQDHGQGYAQYPGRQQQQSYADPAFGQQQYQQPYDPSYGGQAPQAPAQYAGPGSGQSGGQDPYPYQGQPPYDPSYGAEWDTGARPGIPYQAPSPHDPSSYPQGGPAGPGFGGPLPQLQPHPQQPQQYAEPGARPGEQSGPRRDPAGRQGARLEPEPAADEWEEPPEETHPFFTGEDGVTDRGGERSGGGRGAVDNRSGDDEHDDDYDEAGAGDGERRGGKKKGRSGVACLVVAIVLVGGVGGIGYVGHTLYEDRFGPPPDFSGGGSGAVQVDVPDGASGSQIAQLLLKDGVIKSTAAFVIAQGHNPKGNTIQAGAYLLKKGMSGKSAVALMLDPKSRDNLIIAEGSRDTKIYAQIDTRLGLPAGTTQSVAKKEYKTFGLPSWADASKNIQDPLEGFLYPASYPVAKGEKPEDVLKAMVARANSEYGKLDLDSEAEKLGLKDPWQVITVASLVQAEGKTTDDFRKMAEVVYNRISPTNTQTNQYLQFDSTYNYLKGQSNIHISESEITHNHNPYNTYTNKGLPPGPIGNPGQDALSAALNPTHDGWFYFVATDGMDKTQFAKTYPEFLKLKAQFNDQ